MFFSKLLFFPLLYKISCLAENTNSSIVFNEILAAAGRDIVTKDVTRIRGGWPMQDAFFVGILTFASLYLFTYTFDILTHGT